MNAPTVSIANKQRVTSLRRVEIILQKSNGLLFAHVVRAWGIGGVSLVPYSAMVSAAESLPVGQPNNPANWEDSDDITH